MSTPFFLTDAQLRAEIDALSVLRDEAVQGRLSGRLLARRLHHGRAGRRAARLCPRRRDDHGVEPARRGVRLGVSRHPLHEGVRPCRPRPADQHPGRPGDDHRPRPRARRHARVRQTDGARTPHRRGRWRTGRHRCGLSPRPGGVLGRRPRGGTAGRWDGRLHSAVPPRPRRPRRRPRLRRGARHRVLHHLAVCRRPSDAARRWVRGGRRRHRTGGADPPWRAG